MAEDSEDPFGRIIAAPTVALVNLLVDKGLITQEEWQAAVRQQMGEILSEERLDEILAEDSE